MQDEPDAGLADRFLAAWKRIEGHIAGLIAASGEQGKDAHDALRWAERQRVISARVEDFLHDCRRARNAYVHVAFDGYSGPVTVPPREVVHRLERIAVGLTAPPSVTALAQPAHVCDSSTSVVEALAVMREGDFSQLPYRHDQLGWLLVTRSQIARWVEASAEPDGHCLLNLTTPVSGIADVEGVGPVVPRILPPTAMLAEAISELQQAFITPDHEVGGYPALLVVSPSQEAAPPRIVTSDDLPRAYAMLGQ